MSSSTSTNTCEWQSAAHPPCKRNLDLAVGKFCKLHTCNNRGQCLEAISTRWIGKSGCLMPTKVFSYLPLSTSRVQASTADQCPACFTEMCFPLKARQEIRSKCLRAQKGSTAQQQPSRKSSLPFPWSSHPRSPLSSPQYIWYLLLNPTISCSGNAAACGTGSPRWNRC